VEEGKDLIGALCVCQRSDGRKCEATSSTFKEMETWLWCASTDKTPAD